MDFFKSVFSEDPSPSSSPKSDDNSETDPNSPLNSQTQNPNPKIPSITNAWTFGSSLFKTIATKSESVIENYRKDFEDFSSGLRKETAVIRQSASRAVKDLPARLESGAAVAQTSLESVGDAIDTLGSTVSDIIIHGKDSIFNADEDESDGEILESNSNNDWQNLKPYSRIDAVIRAMQCDMKTYCEEPEDVGDYSEWKMSFALEGKNGEIEDLFKENGMIKEIYNEVVPGRVDQETFWSRYFYRVYRVMKAEEARAKLVKRAIEGQEEEELSWDVDEDEDEDNGFQSKDEMKREIEKNGKAIESLKLGDEDEDNGFQSKEEMKREFEKNGKATGSLKLGDGDKVCDNEKEIVSELKSGDGIEEKGHLRGKSDDNELGSEKLGSEGRTDNTSDFSVVSSQPSSREEEDLGWDEIEDIGSGDENKVVAQVSPSRADLRKRLSAAEDDEDLTWDIEDDEDSVKP